MACPPVDPFDLIAFGVTGTMVLLGLTSVIYAALLWLDEKFTTKEH